MFFIFVCEEELSGLVPPVYNSKQCRKCLVLLCFDISQVTFFGCSCCFFFTPSATPVQYSAILSHSPLVVITSNIRSSVDHLLDLSVQILKGAERPST